MSQQAQRRLATFWAGGLLLGVDVAVVQEVLAARPVTAVPLAPPGMLGLLNLRGQLVTAVDARQRLGLPAHAPDDGAVNVIIRTEDDVVSLVVDRAGEVVEVDEGSFEEVGDVVGEAIGALVTGAHKLDDALLLVLDAERTVSVTAG